MTNIAHDIKRDVSWNLRDVSGETLRSSMYLRMDFTLCNFFMTNFGESADIDKCIFDGCDLSRAKINGATIGNTTFIDCNLSFVDFSNVNMSDVKFLNCNLTGVVGDGSHVMNTTIGMVHVVYTKDYIQIGSRGDLISSINEQIRDGRQEILGMSNKLVSYIMEYYKTPLPL